MTLDEAIAMLERAAERTNGLLTETLVEYGEVVKSAAKGMLGKEHDQWPPLAEATLEDKERKGLPTPSPLLRTGEMRDSIVAEVADLTLVVGSDDKKALYQEMGTSRIPPRPFLSISMIDNLPFIEKRLQADAAALITGSREE